MIKRSKSKERAWTQPNFKTIPKWPVFFKNTESNYFANCLLANCLLVNCLLANCLLANRKKKFREGETEKYLTEILVVIRLDQISDEKVSRFPTQVIRSNLNVSTLYRNNTKRDLQTEVGLTVYRQ